MYIYLNNTDLIVVCIFCNSGDWRFLGINVLPIREGSARTRPVCSNVECLLVS